MAFVVDQLDDTVYSKDELGAGRPRNPGPGPGSDSGIVEAQGPGVRGHVGETSSVVGEAYRSLRTSLQFAAVRNQGPGDLGYQPERVRRKDHHSGQPGRGAGQSRRAGGHCLVRSAPSPGWQFFELDEGVGLTTVLLGRCSLEGALQAVPGVDGLSILGAGPRPSDPTAVLGSDRLAEVFEHLRQEFDVVLVDSPPVLLFTDAVILGQVADVTLLVVAAARHWQRTSVVRPRRYPWSMPTSQEWP